MKQKFIMMVGLPGSGKTTKAQEICSRYNAIGESCVIFSSDEIRKDILGDENNQDSNDLVFTELHNRIVEALKNGKHTIYDATNINYKRRMEFLQKIEDIDCKKVCILMAVPFKECCQQNESRERVVPKEVIDRMYRHFHVPYYYEGWDEICVEYPMNWWDKAPAALSFMWNHKDYEQDNPHHKLTLGNHLREAWLWIDNWLEQNPNRFNHDQAVALRIAVALHDCGKPYVKEWKSEDGTTIAHYYNHQNVGAYDSLFYKSTINQLDVAVLILWHMMPFQWGEKAKEKYYKLWGANLHEMILLLNQADNIAK